MTENRMARYKRQITFEEIGEKGQAKLIDSKVCVIGSGGLGSAIASMLVRAGVGHLRIVDRDFTEVSNLQRQVLFTEADAIAAIPKAQAAADRLREANSETEIEVVAEDVTSANIERIIDGVDVVMDGTDNFEIRFLINEVCVKHGIPWIYGGAIGGGGATMNVLPGGPCFRCFMPDMPDPGSYPTCTTVGVIGPVTQVIAAYEAAEALKLLVGASESLSHSYVAIDVWDNICEYIEVDKDPDCPVCGKGVFEILDRVQTRGSAALCGHDAWQITPTSECRADLPLLAERLRRVGTVKLTAFILDFSDGTISFKVFPDGRAIIEAAETETEARKIYAEYIGL